jgi:hypothetical protein
MVILVLICALVFPIIFLISLSRTIQSLIASVAFAFATAAIALIIFTPKMIILLLEGDIEGLNGPSASAGKKGKQLRMSLNFSNRDKNKGTAAAAAAGAASATGELLPSTDTNATGSHKAAAGARARAGGAGNDNGNTESTTTSPLLDLPYFAPAPADLRGIGNFAQRVQVCRSQAEQWKMLLMRTEQGGLSDNMSSSMNSRSSFEALAIDPHILESLVHTAALTAKPQPQSQTQTQTLSNRIRRSSSSAKSGAAPIFVSRNDSEHAVDVYTLLNNNNDEFGNYNYSNNNYNYNCDLQHNGDPHSSIDRGVSPILVTSTGNSTVVEPFSNLVTTAVGVGSEGGGRGLSAKRRAVLEAMEEGADEVEEIVELNATSASISASIATKPPPPLHSKKEVTSTISFNINETSSPTA